MSKTKKGLGDRVLDNAVVKTVLAPIVPPDYSSTQAMKGEDMMGTDVSGVIPEIVVRGTQRNGLYTLTAQERERYLGAVATFIELPTELPKTVRVDGAGYSPELGELMGAGYLGSHVILASSGQMNAGFQNPRYSFLEQLIDDAFSKDIVKKVVQHEALVGGVELHHRTESGLTTALDVLDLGAYQFPAPFAEEGEEGKKKKKRDSPWKELTGRLRLDTPAKTIKSLKAIQQTLASLEGENVEKRLLAEKGIDDLLTLYNQAAEINQRYGSRAVATLDASDNAAYAKVSGAFKFTGENVTTYVILGDRLIAIYEGKKAKGKLKDTDAIVLHVSEEAEIMDRLMASGQLKWDAAMAKSWMQDIALSSFIKAGVEEGQFKTAVSNTMTFYKFLAESDVKKNLDARWFRLRNILYPKGNAMSQDSVEKEFQGLDMDLKWKLVTLTTQEPLIAELFEKLSPREVIDNPYSEEMIPYINKAREMLLRIQEGGQEGTVKGKATGSKRGTGTGPY